MLATDRCAHIFRLRIITGEKSLRMARKGKEEELVYEVKGVDL